jgi:hypothetical protein
MMYGTDLRARFLAAAGLLSGAALVLLLLRILLTGSVRYWFIPENLALAWLSLVYAAALSRELKNRRWLSWQNLSITLLWRLWLRRT